MQMPDDLFRCLVLNTVAAARTLLRRYDAKLKPFGVTVQQFSLLAAIRFHPGEPVATLAQRVFLDRTSLTRNLDLLERKGLARRATSDNDRRARVICVTEAGAEKVAEGEAIIRSVQEDVLSVLPTDERAVFVSALRRLNADRLAAPVACAAAPRQREPRAA